MTCQGLGGLWAWVACLVYFLPQHHHQPLEEITLNQEAGTPAPCTRRAAPLIRSPSSREEHIAGRSPPF